MTGESYDNTGSLSANNWRHVKFIEQFNPERTETAWLMMSDVCKHCVNAPCLEVCPTGAIIRTEFDTVYIQQEVCNGCRDCMAACPFGVIHMSGVENAGKGTAKKCTLCYDRLQHNLTPACAQACPTESIQFGPIDELRQRAAARLQQLQGEGYTQAQLYGADEKILGGLNSFYLLLDKPETYGLPSNPKLPSRSVLPSSIFSIGSAIAVGLAALFSFRVRRVNQLGGDAADAAERED
jgi:formate dehydrogenase iron-sulfur subunit